jgi:hypothetical protein
MKEIKLTQGKVVLVDDEDFEGLNCYSWYAAKRGTRWYAMREDTVFRVICMHREIMKTSDYQVVDHLDFDGLNCQKYNMRNCSKSVNGQNRRTTCNYQGVRKYKKASTYRSRIKVDKREIYLGSFRSEIDAALAYNKAAVFYYGENAKLNNIEEVEKLRLAFKENKLAL